MPSAERVRDRGARRSVSGQQRCESGRPESRDKRGEPGGSAEQPRRVLERPKLRQRPPRRHRSVEAEMRVRGVHRPSGLGRLPGDEHVRALRAHDGEPDGRQRVGYVQRHRHGQDVPQELCVQRRHQRMGCVQGDEHASDVPGRARVQPADRQVGRVQRPGLLVDARQLRVEPTARRLGHLERHHDEQHVQW